MPLGIDQVSLQIGAGAESVGIVGCTGCGKDDAVKGDGRTTEVQSGNLCWTGKLMLQTISIGQFCAESRNGISVSGISTFAQQWRRMWASGLKYSRLSREENRNASDGRWSRWDFPYEEIKDQSPLLYLAERSAEWRIAGVLATKLKASGCWMSRLPD